MAKLKGTAFRLYVNTGTVGSPVYTAITGETDVTLSIGAEVIDTTNKDSSAWGEGIKGFMNWSISGNVKYVESDSGTLDIRSDIMTADATSMIQIKTIDSTKIYSGSLVFEKFELKSSYNGIVECSTSGKGIGVLAYA
jgi:predicted secreted protein